MEVNIEDFLKHKELSEEESDFLHKELKEKINESLKEDTNDIDYCVFEVNGKFYSLDEVEGDGWEDEGKYQTASSVYQVVELCENCASYHRPKDEIARINLFCTINLSRYGNYYSGYDYEYEPPLFFKGVLKHVPEQYIPAHEEVYFTTDLR